MEKVVMTLPIKLNSHTLRLDTMDKRLLLEEAEELCDKLEVYCGDPVAIETNNFTKELRGFMTKL